MMRALVIDRLAPGSLRVADVAVPAPSAGETLVRVRAASVHPTDRHFLQNAQDGLIPGSELVGTVDEAAADDSGPPAGTRVTGIAMGGAWAQYVCVPTTHLAAVPDGLSDPVALSLPLAGASALRALRAIGPILGKRILVTGATGAVGMLAVQLAVIGGAADTLAIARDVHSFDRLRELGATVASDVLGEQLGSVHGVIDNVGGDTLTSAFRLLARDGTLVSVGRASGRPSSLEPDDLLGDGGRSGRSIRTFFLPDEDGMLSEDIAYLLDLARRDRLHSSIDSFENLDGDLTALYEGGWRGRLALDLTS
jgi:NADPH2:quinone reductase